MTRSEWERDVLTPARARAPERAPAFHTSSGHAIRVVYTPDDVADVDYDRDLGDPGAFPFTRGGRSAIDGNGSWSINQTLDVKSLFDQGRAGDGLASLTTSEPAPVMLAQYLALAESCGVDWASVTGVMHGDVLTELIAGGTYFCAVPRALRLAADTAVFAARRVPAWMPIAVNGPRLREAGATPQQELSLAIASALEYVARATAAGLDVEAVAPRVLVAFEIGNDLFEEVAKIRAARLVWARVMRDRFGVSASLCALRIHAHTSAQSLTAAEPLDNAARTTFHALAAVLGGADSLHTQPFDIASASPSTTEAVTLALRTQQILARESGLSSTADPLGGSWWLERRTADMASQATADIDGIAREGGLVAAIETGTCALARGRVQNRAAASGAPLPGPRRRRDAIAVWGTLDALASAINGSSNTMEAMVECARAGVTVREMCDVLRNA